MKKAIFILVLAILFFSCKNNGDTDLGITAATDSAQLFYNGDIITMKGDSAEYV